MWYVVAGLVLFIGLFFWYRLASTPSMVMIHTIKESVRELQRRTLQDYSSSKGKARVGDTRRNQKHHPSALIDKTIEFDYMIMNHEQGIAHAISSRLHRRKLKKYHTHCMMLALLIFAHQLDECEIDHDKVTFEFSETEPDTLVLILILTPQQQKRFARHVLDDA